MLWIINRRLYEIKELVFFVKDGSNANETTSRRVFILTTIINTR